MCVCVLVTGISETTRCPFLPAPKAGPAHTPKEDGCYYSYSPTRVGEIRTNGQTDWRNQKVGFSLAATCYTSARPAHVPAGSLVRILFRFLFFFSLFFTFIYLPTNSHHWKSSTIIINIIGDNWWLSFIILTLSAPWILEKNHFCVMNSYFL